MLFCKKCGEQIEAGEAFCSKCGLPTKEQPTVQETPKVNTASQHMPQMTSNIGGDLLDKAGKIRNQIVGKINDARPKCSKCGTNLIDGVCPNCTAGTEQTNNPDSKFSNHLFNQNEKIVCILGNNYLQNYLSGGSFSKGFSVVSDKRVYFRGTALETIGDKLKRVKVSKAVNIRDVTGISVTYISPIGYIITGAALILLGLIIPVPFFTLGGFVLGAVNFLLYYFKRITILLIQYAGGAIGFNIKWFSSEESMTYQKTVFLAKDRIFDND